MKFSVVICTYNGEKYISSQISSVLNQTRPVDEIIISDDNSRDNTIGIITEKLNEKPFDNYKIVINDSPKGVAQNFCDAVKLAQGDYIFLCDQDDIWSSQKVELFEKNIVNTRELAYFSDGYLIDAKDNLLSGSLWEAIPFSVEMLKKETIYSLMLNRSIVTGSAMAISKRMVDMCSSMVIPEGWIHDDFWGFLAAQEESIIPINEKLYYYRQHENNVIGANKLTFPQKTKKWLENTRIMPLERHRRYVKFNAVLPYSNEKHRNDLLSCINYWKKMDELDGATTINSIKIIFNNIDGYMKFYTGARGLVRDLLSKF